MLEQLQALLANAVGLQFKAQKYHWDVTGPHFSPLHSFYGDQYGAMQEFVDVNAERIRQLGGFPKANLSTLASMSEIQVADEPVSADTALADYRDSLSMFIEMVRSVLDETGRDYATNNWLSGELQALEKALWIADSTLTEVRDAELAVPGGVERDPESED